MAWIVDTDLEVLEEQEEELSALKIEPEEQLDETNPDYTIEEQLSTTVTENHK